MTKEKTLKLKKAPDSDKPKPEKNEAKKVPTYKLKANVKYQGKYLKIGDSCPAGLVKQAKEMGWV